MCMSMVSGYSTVRNPFCRKVNSSELRKYRGIVLGLFRGELCKVMLYLRLSACASWCPEGRSRVQAWEDHVHPCDCVAALHCVQLEEDNRCTPLALMRSAGTVSLKSLLSLLGVQKFNVAGHSPNVLFCSPDA
jgi:hypothetical protein